MTGVLTPLELDDSTTNIIAVDFSPSALKGDPRPDEPSMIPVGGPAMEFAVADRCRHLNIVIHEDMAEVECRDCQSKLNPIWVLMRMAKQETKWAYRRAELIKLREDTAQKTRCKCHHCGGMTPIYR